MVYSKNIEKKKNSKKEGYTDTPNNRTDLDAQSTIQDVHT